MVWSIERTPIIKPLLLLSLLLILPLGSAGCARVIANGETPTPTAMSSLPSDTPSPTVTGTPLVTLEPAQAIETIEPLVTVAPLGTLEPAQARATIEPLLRDPMNCPVPCFWGIVPGTTSLDEAKAFFSRLGFAIFEGIDPNSGRYFDTITYDTRTGYDFSATLQPDSRNLVENIVVTPHLSRPKEGSPREWIAYSPETLIKRYGTPSRVEFAVGLGPNIGINMIMYFDASNLIVNYSGYDMTPKKFCPLTAPFDFVRVWIGENPPDTPSFPTWPLDKATSLTVDQFSQLMLGDPKKACFAVNREAGQ